MASGSGGPRTESPFIIEHDEDSVLDHELVDDGRGLSHANS